MVLEVGEGNVCTGLWKIVLAVSFTRSLERKNCFPLDFKREINEA